MGNLDLKKCDFVSKMPIPIFFSFQHLFLSWLLLFFFLSPLNFYNIILNPLRDYNERTHQHTDIEYFHFMSKRRTLDTSPPSSNSSSSTSTLSSNSSREDSSGHTSSTSLSSGNDSSINSPAGRRKQGGKPTSNTASLNEAGYPNQSDGTNSRTERQRSVTAFLNKLFRYVSSHFSSQQSFISVLTVIFFSL